MTISIIKIDIKARSLTMSSAGHPLPLVVRTKQDKIGVFPLIAKAQSPLGFEMLTKSISVPPFIDTSHDIEPDDMILIFSDGLTEAKNNSNLAFQKQFLATLRGLDRRYPPTVVMDRILQSLQNHMGSSKLADDICLLVIDTKKEDSYESVA